MKSLDFSQAQPIPTPASQELLEAQTAAKAYLQSTDWYSGRYLEEGKPIPEGILAKRIAARLTAYPEAT